MATASLRASLQLAEQFTKISIAVPSLIRNNSAFPLPIPPGKLQTYTIAFVFEPLTKISSSINVAPDPSYRL